MAPVILLKHTLTPSLAPFSLSFVKIVNNNQLKSVPAEIFRLTNLATLLLDANQLTVVPAEIFWLTNLTILGLNNNQLTSVPVEIFQLTNLTVLGCVQPQHPTCPHGTSHFIETHTYSLARSIFTFLC
eukprot:TRINITY_DN723_c0_g1_i14.p1 TRINITY_DN723_c0_g1~~TRINITY_DN723_c0_g1_i14.p1  ORF type:complete len:128 (+),score=24.79 TRINITY_DN723_c0_g1_i14:89-472(+)